MSEPTSKPLTDVTHTNTLRHVSHLMTSVGNFQHYMVSFLSTQPC